MARYVAVLLMMCCTVANAGGVFFDGNTLLRLLAARSVEDRTTGVAYVMGVVDAIDGQRTQYKQCFSIPEKATSTQVADVVQQFLEKHPSGRHFKAADLAASALQEAFPCGKKP